MHVIGTNGVSFPGYSFPAVVVRTLLPRFEPRKNNKTERSRGNREIESSKTRRKQRETKDRNKDGNRV